MLHISGVIDDKCPRVMRRFLTQQRLRTDEYEVGAAAKLLVHMGDELALRHIGKERWPVVNTVVYSSLEPNVESGKTLRKKSPQPRVQRSHIPKQVADLGCIESRVVSRRGAPAHVARGIPGTRAINEYIVGNFAQLRDLRQCRRRAFPFSQPTERRMKWLEIKDAVLRREAQHDLLHGSPMCVPLLCSEAEDGQTGEGFATKRHGGQFFKAWRYARQVCSAARFHVNSLARIKPRVRKLDRKTESSRRRVMAAEISSTECGST